MKTAVWKSDWFVGLLVSLVFLLASSSDLMQSLERKAYDLGVQASSRQPSDEIAVIAIDDQSIANIGRWPWSREIHAKMVDMLTQAQAKVIGSSIFYLEPQVDPGLGFINKMIQYLDSSGLRGTGAGSQLSNMLAEAEQSLNADKKLAESVKTSNNTLLAMLFELGEPQGNPDKPLPDFVSKNALPNVAPPEGVDINDVLPLSAKAAFPPISEIGQYAAGIGHLNANADVDGATRTEPLVVRYYDQFFPSLSLMLAAKSLNLAPEDIHVTLGDGVRLGNLQITTDPLLEMYTFFYKDGETRPAFSVDSFYDVYSGKIPVEKYRGKIVLIGATAAGVGTTQVTPVSPAMAPVVTLAHSVSSILQEDFFVVPGWGLLG
jgi:serine/threonine-protein kinase